MRPKKKKVSTRGERPHSFSVGPKRTQGKKRWGLPDSSPQKGGTAFPTMLTAVEKKKLGPDNNITVLQIKKWTPPDRLKGKSLFETGKNVNEQGFFFREVVKLLCSVRGGGEVVKSALETLEGPAFVPPRDRGVQSRDLNPWRTRPKPKGLLLLGGGVRWFRKTADKTEVESWGRQKKRTAHATGNNQYLAGHQKEKP